MKNLHWSDVLTYASLASAFLTQLVNLGFPQALDSIFPGSGTKAGIAISISLIALGAFIRTANNPTPTNTATVTDSATGLPVQISTVKAPGEPVAVKGS